MRRKIGLKALELGGNAVIGYRQCFDLEGESGIVVRGIGTAATLTRIQPGETSYVQQLGQVSFRTFFVELYKYAQTRFAQSNFLSFTKISSCLFSKEFRF